MNLQRAEYSNIQTDETRPFVSADFVLEENKIYRFYCILLAIFFVLCIIVLEGFRIYTFDDDSPTSTTCPKINSTQSMYIVAVLGCSQSTQLYSFLSNLLSEAGVELETRPGGWEFLHPEKNYLINKLNMGWGDAIQKRWEDASNQGKSILTKFDKIYSDFDIPCILANMQNVKVIYFWRRNLLDRMVCKIRDCFGIKDDHGNPVVFGYPVFADTGNITQLCFDRRHSEKRIQAYIKPNVFNVGRFKYHAKEETDFYNDLQDTMFGRKINLSRIATEDFWQFQAGWDDTKSFESLMKVCDAWDLRCDKHMLQKLMNNWMADKGIWRPRLHSETIYNFTQFLDRFGHVRQLRRFIRHDNSPEIQMLLKKGEIRESSF